jgi:hypothetical protein
MGAGERLTGSTADGPKLPLKSTELAKDWVFAALRSAPQSGLPRVSLRSKPFERKNPAGDTAGLRSSRAQLPDKWGGPNSR